MSSAPAAPLSALADRIINEPKLYGDAVELARAYKALTSDRERLRLAMSSAHDIIAGYQLNPNGNGWQELNNVRGLLFRALNPAALQGQEPL